MIRKIVSGLAVVTIMIALSACGEHPTVITSQQPAQQAPVVIHQQAPAQAPIIIHHDAPKKAPVIVIHHH
jgi:hypothetical protein